MGQARAIAVAVAALASAAVTIGARAAPPLQQLGEISVVGMTPLPGLDMPPSQVPLNTQTAQADDLQQIHGQSLTDLLQGNFQGVNITQSQGNPWQGNLYFHGFTLSPLLGSPSGISVYVDGVRQNEPFSETMNWEAIPDFAIRNLALIPSSNPLYGLNTLGGALVLQTKSGFTDPGGALNVSTGSWGRRQADADFGMHGQKFGFYAGAASDTERGWRKHSSSRVRQVFLRGDWHPNGATQIIMSYTGAYAKLYGTQTIPVAWANTPAAAYTWPDYIVGYLDQYVLQGAHQFAHGWALQAQTYLRLSRSRGFDSNVNDYDAYDAADDGPLGYSASGPLNRASVGQFYYAGLLPTYNPLDPGATINNVPASNELSEVHTRGYGGSFQVSQESWPGGVHNVLTLGTSLDAATNRFTQFAQPAYFPLDPAERGDTLGLRPFSSNPDTFAGTGTRDYGLYFVDVVTPIHALHVTGGGRYDYSTVSVNDLSGKDPAINGRNSFARFNPSLGLTWSVTHALGVYANYDEGMRAPTPIELECASPTAPCVLPDSFSGDPPLKPVVARTLSAGLRGSFDGGNLHWNVSPYYSRVSNDILSIFSGGSRQSYFANLPKTLRKGVDAGLGGTLGRLQWDADASLVEATYGAAFAEQSEFNSSAGADGVIVVQSGDRLPGVPQRMLTLAAEYQFTAAWSLGANLKAYSSQYAMGDENNRDAHGPVPGYALLDLDLNWRVGHRLRVYAQIKNALNRRYFISGQLSGNVFNTPSRLIDTTGPGTPNLFVVPGAPRGIFIGMHYAFGGHG